MRKHYSQPAIEFAEVGTVDVLMASSVLGTDNVIGRPDGWDRGDI